MPTLDRRSLLIGALTACGCLPFAGDAFATSCPPLQRLDPDQGDFESGDLLFAKTPGRIIPFSGDDDAENPLNAWQEATSAIIRELRKKVDRSSAEERLLMHLQSNASTFRAFEYAYETGEEPPSDDRRIPFSGVVTGTVLNPKEHSGHVAIVEVKSDREKNVIEAVSKGVIRTSLLSWLNQRKKERIWQMRHRAPALKRNQIALAAGKYVGQPYSLGKTRASYSLVDVSDFYCSKLVWLSINQSIGDPVDGDPIADRIWPLSPLVVFNSKHLLPVVDQGSYRWC
jgi:hypothetical protein